MSDKLSYMSGLLPEVLQQMADYGFEAGAVVMVESGETVAVYVHDSEDLAVGYERNDYLRT